jgi:hypothetical protein
MIGRNLNIDNSFRLQIQNASASPFTLNLFNLGGNSTTQTSISTSTLSISSSVTISQLTNGVFNVPATFGAIDTASVLISTAIMLPGQTLQDLMNAVNPITDSFGNVGNLFAQQTPNASTYDFTFTLSTIQAWQFSAFPTFAPKQQTSTYATNNPYLTINSPTSITFIQNSEIGNVYKIMGMNVFSTNPQQVLENISYASYDVNGDFLSIGATPTVDPWQENGASLHMVNVDDFDISTNTQFSYIILPTTEVYLTFNYVKSSMSYMREFDQAFASELRMKFLIEQRNLQSLLYRQAIQTQ